MVKANAYAPNVGQTKPQEKPEPSKGNGKIGLFIILGVFVLGIIFFLVVFFVGTLTPPNPNPIEPITNPDSGTNNLPQQINQQTANTTNTQANSGVDDVFKDTDVAPPGLPG